MNTLNESRFHLPYMLNLNISCPASSALLQQNCVMWQNRRTRVLHVQHDSTYDLYGLGDRAVRRQSRREVLQKSLFACYGWKMTANHQVVRAKQAHVVEYRQDEWNCYWTVMQMSDFCFNASRMLSYKERERAHEMIKRNIWFGSKLEQNSFLS